MRIVKKISSSLTLLVIFLVLCTIFWSWIFTFLTDTTAEHKVSLYIHADVPHGTQLAGILEESMPEGIRMVHVRSFDYAMFDSTGLRRADLYVITAEDLLTYGEWFSPLPDGYAAEDALEKDGIAYGIPVAGSALLNTYAVYTEAGPYYLVFGASSLHIEGHDAAVDNAAVTVANLLLSEF